MDLIVMIISMCFNPSHGFEPWALKPFTLITLALLLIKPLLDHQRYNKISSTTHYKLSNLYVVIRKANIIRRYHFHVLYQELQACSVCC